MASLLLNCNLNKRVSGKQRRYEEFAAQIRDKTVVYTYFLDMGRRAAGFVIFRKITDEFEYLLLQASYGSHHWTPPKGHVDPGESDLETALRETKEEAGFNKEDLKIAENFKKELNYAVQGQPKTVIYWLAELHKNTPVTLSPEHQNYKWGNLNTASELSGYKDFQDLLAECENFLVQNYGKM